MYLLSGRLLISVNFRNSLVWWYVQFFWYLYCLPAIFGKNVMNKEEISVLIVVGGLFFG